MRVSNTVKNYIRSEIEKKYPMENLPEYEDAMTRITDFKEGLESKFDMIVKEAVSTFLASNPDIPEDCVRIYQPYLSDRYRRGFARPHQGTNYYHSGWELENKNNEHIGKIFEKREEVFNNIVVTLELGGTKEDLERMLANL